jgi:hypothetical protein
MVTARHRSSDHQIQMRDMPCGPGRIINVQMRRRVLADEIDRDEIWHQEKTPALCSL